MCDMLGVERMRFYLKDWASSYYRFENGDGTQYTIHITTCENGGYYVIVNDSALYLGFDSLDYNGRYEVRHLCGRENIYTTRAVQQILQFHFEKRMVTDDESDE